MHQVLILGAGKSSGYLIDYLINWGGCKLVLADLSVSQLEPYKDKLETHLLQPNDPQTRFHLISSSYLVISMLPAIMHPEIAADCLRAGVHLATASYISPELREMESEIHASGLWFMNECGLDPGLDHMSAMRMFSTIREKGGKITEFHSYCGGLISQESMDNPWGYKFSWNPRNVILAGQGTAKFLEHGELRFSPYYRLFGSAREVTFQDGSSWDGYPNRDSVSYRTVYGLEDVETMVRGTLRYKGFCEAWNIFVQMGITDDSYTFPIKPGMTFRDFSSAFLPDSGNDFGARIKKMNSGSFSNDAIEKVLWTGLFDSKLIELEQGSPAMILQHLLEDKWKLQPEDKDLVLMQHVVAYELAGRKEVLTASLQVEGIDAKHTAMAKTVGLPLAITCRLFLEDKLSQRGVLMPSSPEVYDQVLPEMESLGVHFHETES